MTVMLQCKFACGVHSTEDNVQLCNHRGCEQPRLLSDGLLSLYIFAILVLVLSIHDMWSFCVLVHFTTFAFSRIFRFRSCFSFLVSARVFTRYVSMCLTDVLFILILLYILISFLQVTLPLYSFYTLCLDLSRCILQFLLRDIR